MIVKQFIVTSVAVAILCSQHTTRPTTSVDNLPAIRYAQPHHRNAHRECESTITRILSTSQMKSNKFLRVVKVQPAVIEDDHRLSAKYGNTVAHYDADTAQMTVVGSSCSPHAIMHELMHVKTYQTLDAHPAFMKEWNQSMKSEQPYAYDDNRPTSRKCIGGRNGAISTYACKNAWEDIAEIGSYAATNPAQFQNRLFKDTLLKKKVEILKKYGMMNETY